MACSRDRERFSSRALPTVCHPHQIPLPTRPSSNYPVGIGTNASLPNSRFSGLQIHAPQQVCEARVRAQRVVDWFHSNCHYEVIFISLLQPLERLVLLPKGRIDFGSAKSRNILFLRQLVQLIEHLLCLCPSARQRIATPKKH